MSDLKILERYHSLLKPHLGVFLAAILFDIAMTLLGLAMPLFTRAMFDWAYPNRDLALLNAMVSAIVVAYFIYFFLSVASDYLKIYVNQEVSAGLSERIYHAIHCLPLKFHIEKKPGDLLIRITDDVHKAVGMAADVLPIVIIDGGRFIIILAIALSINLELTLLALLAVPLYAIEAKFYAARLSGVEREAIEADSDILSRAQERLAGIKTVKAFGQERNETLSFSRLIRRRYRVAVKGKVLDVIRTFTNSITLQMWSVFLTWYLGYQVVRGALSIGEIVALMLYIDQLGDPIRSFIGLFTEWKTSLVSMRRLDEVLEQPAEGGLASGGEGISIGEGTVEASHLSFAYAPDREVLHDVEVKFRPKSMTAIVGASGSGKSTLVNLLLRFFDPSSGVILIDGQDIREARIHELRGRIGIVSQETTIFDGTVIENILYGNEKLERGDAMRAARLSGAHDFIERLPGGYDAPVGVGGELLSAGQRQRIAIARTLLREPKIIILDEATSALDAESEYRIQEAIAVLGRSRTVIVIAHRLSTIKAADEILVLDEGRFVERGLFDELLERRGAFYRFYWRQFGGLAAFRQQLDLELERAARYGSKFCLAAARVIPYGRIEEAEGPAAAQRFMDGVDLLLKKGMRVGDNSAVLEREKILLLLPEIELGQLRLFFERLRGLLQRAAPPEISHAVGADELVIAGTRVTKKLFRTPEELLHAITAAADALASGSSPLVIGEEELAARHGARGGKA